MAKKSFKNSARESVASAFFGKIEAEPIDEEKKKQDTMDTESVLSAKGVEDVKNTRGVLSAKDTLNTITVRNTEDVLNTQKPKAKQEETGDYRINLKLKGEFKEYLSDVAWENRTSITNYLNDLIEKDRKEKRG